MQHIELTSVDLTQGSASVVVNDVIDLSSIPAGYVLSVDGFDVLMSLDGGGDQELTLSSVFPGTSIAGRRAFILETVSQSNDLMTKLTAIHDKVIELSATREAVFTSDDETITYVDRLGESHTISTQKRFENLIDDVESASGNIKAMRSVVYDAMCEANRLKFGASGFVEFGKHLDNGSSLVAINQGMNVDTGKSDIIQMGAVTNEKGVSNSDYPILNIGGSILHVNEISRGSADWQANTIKLPPAPDGLDKADGTGRHADLAAAIVAGGNDLSASRLSGQRIVVVRKKTVTVTDKVYPHGLVQYAATTADGITLINNPDQDECRFYDDNWASDTTTVGKIFEWDNLSDTNKDTVLRNPKHNLRYEDDVLKQDIAQIFVYQTATVYDETVSTKTIMETEGFNSVDNEPGLFTDGLTWEMIVIGTVDVMNQGAYHPVYNDNGTTTFWHSDNTTNSKYGWDESSAKEPSSISDCFKLGGTNSVSVFAFDGHGSVDSTISKHPSGRYYDAIYADQITDLRLDVSHKFDIQRANKLAKNMSVNGNASANCTEYVPFLYPKDVANDVVVQFTLNSTATYNPINSGGSLEMTVTDVQDDTLYFSGLESDVWYLVGSNGEAMSVNRVSKETDGVYIAYGSSRKAYIYGSGDVLTEFNAKFPSGTTITVMAEAPSKHKSKYRADVIGTPAEILATFPDGVHASWIPVIPDGTSKEYNYTRKAVSDNDGLVTSDDGSTWSTAASMVQMGASNSVTTSSPTASKVYLLQYEYAPNFTEQSDAVRIDYSDFKVDAMNSNAVTNGAALVQSVTSSIPTNSTAPTNLYGYNAQGYNIETDGSLDLTRIPIYDSPALGGTGPELEAMFYSHIADSGIIEHYVIDASDPTIHHKISGIPQVYIKPSQVT